MDVVESFYKLNASRQLLDSDVSNISDAAKVEYPKTNYNYTSSSIGNYQPGVCGLQNLGNTCFMNSALQCLSNVSELTEYFLQNTYKNEINDQNPLGTRGLLVRAYAEFLKELWSGKANSIRCWRLKCVIGKFAPRFSGFAQHDSQELTAFMLDGLHEDLNRVKIKPKENNESKEIEDKEPDGIESKEPDAIKSKESEIIKSKESEIIKSKESEAIKSKESEAIESKEPQTAIQAWNDYTKQDDSIIVDFMHGQLRSTLTCGMCKKISVKYDPFCFLSIPIPANEIEINAVMNNDQMLDNDQVGVENGGIVENGHCVTKQSSSVEIATRSSSQILLEQSYEIITWFLFLLNYVNPLKLIYEMLKNLYSSVLPLEKCMQMFFTADHLCGDDMYNCERCKKLRNGIKHSSLTRLPKVLIIHLKRFRHDGAYNTKLGTRITFPLYGLNMRPFMHSEALRDTNGQLVSTHYDLCGLISHRGQNMEYGHYIAYCRNARDQNWYEFDDSMVTRVSPAEIARQEAYVLFYKRRDLLYQEEEEGDDLLNEEEAMETADDEATA